MSDLQDSDRNYRRGAIMGLTMAEAFVLICFALLLLFSFWQWEVEKQNTPAVEAFRELPAGQQQTILASAKDGSIEAFVKLKENGADFAVHSSSDQPQDKWRFIDKDDLLRLVDAAQSLPNDLQRDLADMVEADKAADILKEMAVLEDISASSEFVQELLNSGYNIEELLDVANVMDTLARSGQSVDDLLVAAEKLEGLESVGQTLAQISSKIKNAEAQEIALVSALRSELGGLVRSIGGNIDDTGAIILSDKVLFNQGKATITPSLERFLKQACQPWLATLKGSGVDISEVKIEGHASSEGQRGASPQAAFLSNLNLSQQRSQAVSRTCLEFVDDPELLDWARKHLIAVGYSSVRPILKNGEEDKVASRRVVFSALPNRKSLLDEIENEAGVARYDRALFRGWSDENNDCQNTRHEILEIRSASDVSMTRDKCAVTNGKWTDQYTGRVFTKATDIEVDHLIPLKWAWDRGAHAWTEQKRIEFFNDPENLFVVSAVVNRDKGAKSPLDWLPPSADFHCQYVSSFMKNVSSLQLEVSAVEMTGLNALKDNACK
jgi:outer membrane protein OmpA-like peptidoglycan-associated protein